MSKQFFDIHHNGSAYTAYLADQFRTYGRPIDRYEVRKVNEDGDREYVGFADCGRGWTIEQRKRCVAERLAAA